MIVFFLSVVISLIGLTQTSAGAQAETQTPAAASDPKPPQPSPVKTSPAYPLREIRITGNENFSRERIIAVLGLEIGQPVTEADFRKATRKLDAAGVFHSIQYRFGPRGDGYSVTFTVEEIADLFSVRLEGFGVPAGTLHALLQEQIPLYAPKVPPTGAMARRIGNVLQTYWTQQGKESKVGGQIRALANGQFEMVYQPEEAIQNIAFTRFENTTVIPPLELQQKFNNIAMGIPYSEYRLRELLKFNVAPLFAERGYLDVKFCPCRTEPDTETLGLVVTIHVEEGEEYKFGKIQLPETGVVEPEKLRKLITFSSGETANMGLVEAAVIELGDQFKANGYIKVRTESSQAVDRETKTVDIALRVAPGALYRFQRLQIKGIDPIGEAAVRKRWGLKVGDPFKLSYPAVFLNRIRQEHMFDNLTKTNWRINENDADHTVEVELIFN